jgi:hypothetical protein
MSEQKWVRSCLRHLSRRLEHLGHLASPPTVGRLSRKLGYSLQVNVKKQEATAAHPDREPQFERLESQRQVFQAAGWPIVSVDTKKKELIGNFKNAGQAWGQAAEAVNVHDSPKTPWHEPCPMPTGCATSMRLCSTLCCDTMQDEPLS